MEKVLGKYRFVGGVNEPFLFEGRVGNLECDTRPMERVIGAVEIIAGRQIGPLCMLGRFAMRHFVVESWKGGGGRSGFAFRSREGQLAWVKPDWIGGDIGLDDLWASSAFVCGERSTSSHLTHQDPVTYHSRLQQQPGYISKVLERDRSGHMQPPSKDK